jgi:hypothetical protein
MKRHGGKKLALSKETLRTIGSEELAAVNGGKIVVQSLITCFSEFVRCQTYSCQGSICNTDDLVTTK